VLTPEIEERDEVEVGNSAKHNKTFYFEWYYVYYFIIQEDHKKNWTWTHLFSLAAVTVKWQISKLQFSNFKAVIPSCRVEILLVLEGSIILVKSTKV
jgi:hypothetical protein